MKTYRIKSNRSSFLVTFNTDSEALQYASDMSDGAGLPVIEKLMFGVWHSWDFRNEKWVAVS